MAAHMRSGPTDERCLASANRVLPIVHGPMLGKSGADPLFTTDAGALLHRGAVLRTLRLFDDLTGLPVGAESHLSLIDGFCDG